MYEVCKISIQRKIEKGTIGTYKESLAKKLGTLYFYGALSDEDYGELMDMLGSNKKDS